MAIERIISGGQTGADQGGLEAAVLLGLGTGGTAPKGWITEKGSYPELCVTYGLTEGPYDPKTYPKRTFANVRDSDGTVIFGNIEGSPGSMLTLKYCSSKFLQKPCLLNPTTKDDLLGWIGQNDIHVLNIAGNRESKNPGIQERVRDFLIAALKERI